MEKVIFTFDFDLHVDMVEIRGGSKGGGKVAGGPRPLQSEVCPQMKFLVSNWTPGMKIL